MLPVSPKLPETSRLVVIVLVVSDNVSLGLPSTEKCSLVGSLLAAFIASILPASLFAIEPMYISELPLVGAIRNICAAPKFWTTPVSNPATIVCGSGRYPELDKTPKAPLPVQVKLGTVVVFVIITPDTSANYRAGSLTSPNAIVEPVNRMLWCVELLRSTKSTKPLLVSTTQPCWPNSFVAFTRQVPRVPGLAYN